MSTAAGGDLSSPRPCGVLLAIGLDRLTDNFTGTEWRPVKEINEATGGGPATTILAGLGVGYDATVWSAVVIAITIFFGLDLHGCAGRQSS